MRVCVYGAGSIGGNLAARLAQAGADVSVVVRGENLAAIRANGLTLETASKTITAKVRASANPADLGVQDLVLVTVKTPALASVAAGIAPLLGPDTPVVFVLNGIPWWYGDGLRGPFAGMKLDQLDPDGVLHTTIGTQRSVGGVVYAACSVIRPGVVKLTSPHNKLIIGEIDGQITPRAQAIADLLSKAGLGGALSPDIRTEVWGKLIVNLGSAPVAVLTGAGVSTNIVEPAVERAIRAIYAEASAIACTLGSPVQLNVEHWISNARNSPHKPSILQDLELGRSMEVLTLFDAPLALARIAGVETPTLDLIVALARLRAQAAGLYG